jgi:uncharacterized membrane protein
MAILIGVYYLDMLLLFIIALPIMLVLDLTWVGVIANNFYRTEYGPLYSPHIIVSAVVLFYVIYVLGLVYFVIKPVLITRSIKSLILNAAFFALVAYGTYDLTSLSVTVGWPVALSVVDMSWGIFCAIVTTYLIATRLLKK